MIVKIDAGAYYDCDKSETNNKTMGGLIVRRA